MLYLTPGTQIRAFTLTKILGKGGMSAVWKAHHAETGQDYALKILHGSVADDRSIRQRFFEEGLIQARISHPNVVAVKGRIEDHPIHALVMEYVEGPSLKTYVEGHPNGLPLPEVKTIATGILSALNASHRRGIIHRDVKPSNVILARDFQTLIPKLTDFGIAKVKFLRSHTVKGAPMGTPHFMSPEQLRDSHQVTGLTDIYSLGVTLYFMLTNAYPFDDEDWNQLIVKISVGDYLPTSARRPNLSPAIDELIERCLSVKPEDRPQSVREILEIILSTPWIEIEPTDPVPFPPLLAGDGQDSVETDAVTQADAPQPGTPGLAEESASISRDQPEPPWQEQELSGEFQSLEPTDLAKSFKRSNRIALLLILGLLFVGALFGSKYYLDWMNDRPREIATLSQEPSHASDTDELQRQAEQQPVVGSHPVTDRQELARTDVLADRPGVSGSGLPSDVQSSAEPGPALGASQVAEAGRVEEADLEPTFQLAAGFSPTGDDERVPTVLPQPASEIQPVVPPVPSSIQERDLSEPTAIGDSSPDSGPNGASPTDRTASSQAPTSPEQPATEQTEVPSEDQRLARAIQGVQEGSSIPEPTEPPTSASSGEESTRRTSEVEDDTEPDVRVSDAYPDGSYVLSGREAERAAELAWQRRQQELSGARSSSEPTRTDETAPDTRPVRTTDTSGSTQRPSGTAQGAQEGALPQLTPLQINRALRARRAQFRACFEETDSQPIEMRIAIRSDGTVSYATSRTAGADSSVVRCLVGELAQTRFESFEGNPMNIHHTFTRVGP